jgi:hypothetical protein
MRIWKNECGSGKIIADMKKLIRIWKNDCRTGKITADLDK